MWHTKPATEVLKELSSNPETGLTKSAVQKKQAEHGKNKLLQKKPKSILMLFVRQLKDWLIYVLFAAVVITIFMGEYIDSGIILAVILINATLGVVQEVKAGKAIEALQKMSSPHALVRRDGHVSEIEASELVPGDMVILDAGRFVPADIRLTESAALQVEESALTGESVPVEKDAEAALEDEGMPVGDRINMAYMGTLVTSGRGEGVVAATGMDTEVGGIAGMLHDDESKTPLEIRLNELGKTLGKIAIGICVFIFILAYFQGRDLAEMFLIAVSLAVASIPEGLAAIVAVVLSIGVMAMSKRNAIIKRLPAVETLGSVNIVCSDKTGTLTQNKMEVVGVFTSEGILELNEAKDIEESEGLLLLAKGMVLCSDATLENDDSTGDPTEIALLKFADSLGINRGKLKQENHRVGEFAFDSDRKRMSVLVEQNGRFRVFTKGALGSFYDIVSGVNRNGETVSFSEAEKRNFQEAAHRMSENALRTLALAYKETNRKIGPEEMEKDLILVGMTGMIDPPREEVKSSIELARNAGITTIMITGDHKETALAIAKDLGIADNAEQAVSGKDFESIPEEELAQKIGDYRIFARVSPEHKVRIVKGLKANGNIVSMTGDGVNDAPSLNAADIGVAMGITGTDVAKGAADMILTDDNFATIISAIEHGRNIYNNIKKAVIFLLSSNLGEVITMLVALLIGWAAPFIATQLLWINLITDSLPAIALGMDKNDPDVMNEKPRDPKESFFARGATFQIITGGLLIGLVSIASFWLGFHLKGFTPAAGNAGQNVLEYARTMAFMTLVFAQLFYALNIHAFGKSIFKAGLFSNMYLFGAVILGIALQLVVLYIPVLRNAFQLQILDLNGWLICVGLGFVPFAVLEVMKMFKRTRR